MRSIIFTLALVSPSLPCLGDAKACPPLGRVLPAPQSPSHSQTVKLAIDSLTADLDSFFSANFAHSGVSIGVKSIHEDSLLFSHHFTPPNLSDIGTHKIDENTIYRVGSVSKIIPAMAVLQNSNINMESSVLEYIPDLKSKSNIHDSIHVIPWEDITIRSLATHLSGLATDMAFDLALFPGQWTQMGLPEVSNRTGPDCSGLPGTRPCTSKDIIESLNRRPPVYMPFTTPVYSNIGFAVLGMVVEAVTGQKFDEVAKSSIFDVAGMKNTVFNGPSSSFLEKGFVPEGDPTWNLTLGVFEPAGGMFSNTVDMIAFCEAVLKNNLLSPAKTSEWLKPYSHTSSIGVSVGAPWEILRSNNLTQDQRVIDVYTKSGDLGMYHAHVGVVPDYDIAITVLTAGLEVTFEPNARTEIFSTVIQSLLPAIDKAAREAVSESGYVGTFVDDSSNATLQLSMDDGPGLLIDAFVVRGFDVLANFPSYSFGSAGSSTSGADGAYIEGRLYPTDITKSKTRQRRQRGNCSTETAWRAAFETMTEGQRTMLNQKLFYIDGSCESWFGLDRSAYNYLSLAEFVFRGDKEGYVREVRNPAFNVTLKIVK